MPIRKIDNKGSINTTFGSLNPTDGMNDILTMVRVAGAGTDVASLPSSIDGVTMAAGDRFLRTSEATNLNTPTEHANNGIWVYTSSTSAAIRPSDYDTNRTIRSKMVVALEGTSNAYDNLQGRGLYLLAKSDVTPGTTAHMFTKIMDRRIADTGTTPSTTQGHIIEGGTLLRNWALIQKGLILGSGNGHNPIAISAGSNITTNTTLTADTASTGRSFLIYTGTGGHTITMPATNQMTYNLFYYIVNNGTGLLSIAAGGASTLNGSTGSVSLAPGQVAICYGLSSTDTQVNILTERSTAPQVFTASGSISARGSNTVTFDGAAGQTLTLPAAIPGAGPYEVFNIDSTDTVTIQRAGSDHIGGASTTTIKLKAGASVKLVVLTSGTWVPIWDVGQEVASGYQVVTSNVVGAGTVATITVQGDEVTPMLIHGNIPNIANSSGPGVNVVRAVKDSTTVLTQTEMHSTGNAYLLGDYHGIITVPPFSGNKTFNLTTSSGGGTVTAYASSTFPCYIRASWAPGNS